MKKNKLVLPLIFLLFIFLSFILIIDDSKEYETSFNMTVSRDFKNLNAKKTVVEFYFPESYNTFNSQFILQPYSSSISFNPEPDEKYFDYDNFNNKIVRFSYNNIYGFSVNLRFNGLLKTKNRFINYIPFPYNEKDIPSSLYIYLDDSFESGLVDFANEIGKNKSNLISLLLKIKSYVDNNIIYTPFFGNRNSSQVLNMKIANREEIIDFYINILRILGVPSRICCGIKIPQNFKIFIGEKNQKIDFNFGKGVTTFLEIWTKDYGWIIFDPFLSFYYSLNNFIKLGHAKNSTQLRYIYIESKSLDINFNESFSINFSKNDQINIFNIYEDYLNSYFILSNDFYNFYKTNINKENENIERFYYPGFEDKEEKLLFFKGFEPNIDFSINNFSILQSFYLSKNYVFKELNLNTNDNSSEFELKIYRGLDLNEKYLVYQTKIDKNNKIFSKKGILKIALPSLYFNKGIYTVNIFVAEQNKNCIFYLNEMPSFHGFFNMLILKDGEKIKTNLIMPIIFKYD